MIKDTYISPSVMGDRFSTIAKVETFEYIYPPPRWFSRIVKNRVNILILYKGSERYIVYAHAHVLRLAHGENGGNYQGQGV